MTSLSKREKELVSLGAAVGSNCVPCVVFHVKAAKGCGITNAELTETIELAEKVKKVPASMVLNAANEEIDITKDETKEYTDSQSECGC